MKIEEFIEARVSEDEIAAAAALESLRVDQDYLSEDWAWYRSVGWGGLANRAGTRSWGESTAESSHINRHGPARVLRQCAMVRAMLKHAATAAEMDDRIENEWGGFGSRDLNTDPVIDTLMHRDLAAVWSDHPDYQQEWKP